MSLAVDEFRHRHTLPDMRGWHFPARMVEIDDILGETVGRNPTAQLPSIGNFQLPKP